MICLRIWVFIFRIIVLFTACGLLLYDITPAGKICFIKCQNSSFSGIAVAPPERFAQRFPAAVMII